MNILNRTAFRLIAALISAGFLFAANAQEVSIPDPNLNAAVREALNKPVGPLTEQDMLTLSNLDARSRNISNVQGLETARNLSLLLLESNSLTNLDLPNTLTNLDLLALGLNPLSRCSIPGGLPKLRVLVMDDCQLTNLTLPANLTGMR